MADKNDPAITPEQAKLARALMVDFIGDELPDDTEVDGEEVDGDAYTDLLDALEAVATQSE